jgi:hypothetical protein
MCVHHFTAYICGHCDLPMLQICPLVNQNPMFPPCSLPAEWPTYTEIFCHACSRVLWNENTIRREAEHRKLHEQVPCLCRCGIAYTEEEMRNAMEIKAEAAQNRRNRVVAWRSNAVCSGEEKPIFENGVGGQKQQSWADEQHMSNERTSTCEYADHFIRPEYERISEQFRIQPKHIIPGVFMESYPENGQYGAISYENNVTGVGATRSSGKRQLVQICQVSQGFIERPNQYLAHYLADKGTIPPFDVQHTSQVKPAHHTLDILKKLSGVTSEVGLSYLPSRSSSSPR